MFGYLTANFSGLTEEESQRYKSAYCGLCRCLYEKYGTCSRFMLSYDMVFLILLLESLYEPNEESDSKNCIVHPFKQRYFHISSVTEYAADMTVAVSYLKLLDDWNDAHSLSSKFSAELIQKNYQTVKDKYPKKIQMMEKSLLDLSSMEKSNEQEPDKAAMLFGQFMASVFGYIEDFWYNSLFSLGDKLGKYIYLMDAAVDLDSDIKNKNYNPFSGYYGMDNKDRFTDILKSYLSEVLDILDYLPLINDISILKNVICSGTWANFERKYESAGSV